MSTKVTTGEVRFSFPHVFQPHANNQGQEAKYSVTILIPKTDTATLQAIQGAMEAAAQEGISTKFNGQRPAMLKNPLHDGDGVRPNGEPFGEECRGHMVMTASSKQRPEVVDANLQAILNPAEVYAGCYGRVSLNFFPYNTNGNRGIGCGLNNVQKLRDGDPLTGRTTAADDFGGAASVSNMELGTQTAQAGTPVQTGMQNVNNPISAQTGAINPVTGMPMNQSGVMGL